MNIYLGQIAGVTTKYLDKRIIRNVIAPNIPSYWKIYLTSLLTGKYISN